MALEVVTDGKNNKTEKNDKEYVHNKRTRDRTCVLFCLPPSFVLIDNKCILSCAIMWSFCCPLNESNEELRMKQWHLYFHTFFSSFCPQDYAIKAEISLALLSFIFGGPRKKRKKKI